MSATPFDAFNAGLRAPFPYFGGKRKAVDVVWQAFGDVVNYVEPFCGSAAMLLAAPAPKPDTVRIETINDADGFVANFWRACAADPDGLALALDWPVNETDLLARHLWLVQRRDELTKQLHACPEFYELRHAAWWCWGACAWIGGGWCAGDGPWVLDAGRVVATTAAGGVNRKLPHLGDGGRGVNRQLPHLSDGGQGVNRQLQHLSDGGQGGERLDFLRGWLQALSRRMRDVRVACGDYARVLKDSVTARNGLTGVFLDPPYTVGNLDYAVGGAGGPLANEVRAWCAANGANTGLQIVLCGQSGEHDALIAQGWSKRAWLAGNGYAKNQDAKVNRAKEAIWCSPACLAQTGQVHDLFTEGVI